MIIKRNDFYNAGRLEYMPGTVEAEIFVRILEEARSVGPFTVEITKHIWLNHIRKAESGINKFLNLGHRFSDTRFEAACKRVIFYDLCSPALVETQYCSNVWIPFLLITQQTFTNNVFYSDSISLYP